MTVRTLMRELGEFDPKATVCIRRDGHGLDIGKDYTLTIPSKLEREIEKLYEENNGL